MKVLAAIGRAIVKLWRFCSGTIKICVGMAFILLVLAIIMPDNVLKVIEIIRGIAT